MREIIFLHIGEAGIRVGSNCWEQFCLEHGIGNDGKVIPDSSPAQRDGCFPTLFNETKDEQFVPRGLFLDLEPNAVDDIRLSSQRDLFNASLMVNAKHSASDLFSRGYSTVGKEILAVSLDKIRHMTHSCQNFQGFAVFSSVAGGTGSGFGSLLLERLADEYGKKSKLAFPVFNSPQCGRSIIEPYNSVLSTRYLSEHADVSVMLDNNALYDISREQLQMERPTSRNLNELIAQHVSALTTSLRFESALNSDLAEIKANLVPFPRLNFMVSSYSPIVPYERQAFEKMSTGEITNLAFEPETLMAKCDPSTGKYMSCCLMYRGDVVPKDVGEAVLGVSQKKSIRFADWISTGFKCGVSYQSPLTSKNSNLANFKRSVCMVGNSTAIQQVFSEINHKFDLMFARKAFVHWFVKEGLEEAELSEARESAAIAEKDCEEINLSEEAD